MNEVITGFTADDITHMQL